MLFEKLYIGKVRLNGSLKPPQMSSASFEI